MSIRITTLSIVLTIASFINSSAQEFIFYCSNTTGTFQVYSKDLSTDQVTTISSNENYNYWWSEPSPDGKELLLMRSPVMEGVRDMFDYEFSQMVKTKIDGSEEVTLLDINDNNWNAFGNPHWHPGGERIIFLAQPTDEFFIYTMDPDGSNPVKITNQFSLDPHWSHSGDQIVFIGINANPTTPASFDDFEVFTADYDYNSNSVSNILQLTDDTRRDQDPCFSPDDDKIAFSSATNIDLSIAHITVMDASGANRTDYVNDNTTNGGPVNWGSDNRIYYHNVNFNIPPFTPFTAKRYDVSNQSNTDLFPPITEGYISPFYFNKTTSSLSENEKLVSDQLVYPNPTSGILWIENVRNTKTTFRLYSIQGEKLIEKTILQSQEIDIAHLTHGLYLYTLSADGLNQSGRVVKMGE